MPRRNCWVASCTGLTRFFLGEFVAARALLERCMGLADPAHRTIAGSVLRSLRYDARVPRPDPGVPGLHRSGTVTDGRSVVGGPPAQTRPYAGSRARFCELDRLAHSARLDDAPEEVLALSTEHGFPLLFGLGTGIPRTVVDRARASAGRPCAAHAGAGGIACHPEPS